MASIYDRSPGSQEMERSGINPEGSLASWNAMTSVNAPNANVYKIASFGKSVAFPGQQPAFPPAWRRGFSATPGILSNKVYVKNAP